MTATNEPLADQAPPDSRRRSGLAELPALSIDCVSHSYGARRALKDIGFTVARASFTALLGLNGAGKSTLVSLITRLFGIQAGRISIFGHDIGMAPGEALRLAAILKAGNAVDVMRRKRTSHLDSKILGGHYFQFEVLTDCPVITATFGKSSGRLALEFAFAGAADIRADHKAKQMLGIDAFSM